MWPGTIWYWCLPGPAVLSLVSLGRGADMGQWWHPPLPQAPTMSSRLLLLTVLPVLLGLPVAAVQKRSQGGC